MTLPEITAAIQSVKTGINIVRGFNQLKTEFEVKSATLELLNSIIDVQNNLLTIQASYQSLFDSKSEIEKELVNLKNWETTKLNYALKQISPGCFVYVMKDAQNSTDNSYWLCANCFNTKNHKSIFQRKYASGEDVVCHSCNAELNIPSKTQHQIPKPTGW